MAGGNEPKKRPGEPLRIQSETWNALIDMLAEYKRNKGFTGNQSLTSLIQSKLDVFVRNETAGSLPIYSVLRIAGTGINISFDNQHAFNRRPVIDGDTPINNTDAIVIIQSPATDDPDQLVRGVVSGLTLCKVKINNPAHEFAEPVSGETDYLTSVDCGPVRILGYGPIPNEGSDGSDYLMSTGSDNLYLGFVQVLNNCGNSQAGSDTTINLVTNVCPILDSAGSLESGASGNIVTGITVEYTPITLPPGTVIGTPFCVDNPTLCCDCEPAMDGYNGEGWYCIEDEFNVCGATLYINNTNKCDAGIVICLGPFATEEEAVTACAPLETPCCFDDAVNEVPMCTDLIFNITNSTGSLAGNDGTRLVAYFGISCLWRIAKDDSPNSILYNGNSSLGLDFVSSAAIVDENNGGQLQLTRTSFSAITATRNDGGCVPSIWHFTITISGVPFWDDGSMDVEIINPCGL